MMQSIQKDAAARMEKSVKSLEHELSKIRTGRANVSLLDHVQVEYYGSMVPLSQAANVSVTDYRSLTIQVWERNMVAVIEKALINSDLGLTPNTAGQNIHINLPPLTEERRKDLVKIVRNEGEQAKVAIRNVRRKGMDQLKKIHKDGDAGEDEVQAAEKELDKVTQKYVAAVDEVVQKKEAELMEV